MGGRETANFPGNPSTILVFQIQKAKSKEGGRKDTLL